MLADGGCAEQAGSSATVICFPLLDVCNQYLWLFSMPLSYRLLATILYPT